MANIFDSDILITKTNGNVYLDLTCGYGQPCVTTIYLKKNDGTMKELKKFDNNAIKFEIGKVSDLKYNALEIHSTITDVHDSTTEKLDISLEVKVYDIDTNFVDTGFTRKTKGKGAIFHSFYTVTIY